MSMLSEHHPQRLDEGARRIGRGFTLVEALVTLLIVTLLTTGVATGVAFAQRQYVKAIVTSESKVLYSTLETILRHELSYTDSIKEDASGVVWFYGVDYSYAIGEDSYFKVIVSDENGNEIAYNRGELALSRDTDSDQFKPQQLVSSTAYTNGMTAGASLSIESSGGTEYVRVDLIIYNNEGTALIHEPFDVVPLNADIIHE